MEKERTDWEVLEKLPLTEFSLEELLEEREPEPPAPEPKPRKKASRPKKETAIPEGPAAPAKEKSPAPCSENLHAGHRERLRQRFLNEGLDHFDDHNILVSFWGMQ